jgi:hypothetical protein
VALRLPVSIDDDFRPLIFRKMAGLDAFRNRFRLIAKRSAQNTPKSAAVKISEKRTAKPCCNVRTFAAYSPHDAPGVVPRMRV